jgi:hypothetical protein
MQFPTRDQAALEDEDWSEPPRTGLNSEPADDEEPSSRPPEALTSLYEQLKDVITDLGGFVVPKMQWSCPKDASWILPNNTIKCSTPDEVFLLLKSSDRIAHDVETLQSILGENSPRSPLSKQIDSLQKSHVVALRKWYDLKPGREFRCFVKNNTLVGICQRDVSVKHQHIVDKVDEIQERIETFYTTVLHKKFPLADYVFDCYVPEAQNASVRVVDFNPASLNSTTNPLLFTWEELDGLHGQMQYGESSQSIEFRFIDQDIPLKPESALYGVPFDFVDASAGSALSTLLEEARNGTMPWDQVCKTADR